MSSVRPRRLLTAAITLAALALPGTALAAAHPSAPRAHSFSVSGLIVAHQGRRVTLLTSDGAIAGRSVGVRRLTVNVPAPRLGRNHALLTTAPLLITGDRLTVTGRQVGRTLDVTGATQQSQPTATLLGAIVGVSGTNLTLVAIDPSNPASLSGGLVFSVDASAATVSLDGAASSTSALTMGEVVVVMGERSGPAMLASTVTAYSTPPSVAIGDVTAVSGTSVTLTDATGASSTVDLSSAAIELDGNAASVSDLALGQSMLAVGASASGTLTADAAFVRDGHDRAPVGDNPGGQGRGPGSGFGERQGVHHVLLGTVTSSDGTTLTVTPIDPRTGMSSPDGDTVAVTMTGASITRDDAAASATDIAPGDTIVAVGDNQDGTVSASSIDAFSTPPAATTGQVTDVSGNTLTVQTPDVAGVSGAVVSVDITSAAWTPVVPEGASPPSQINVGDVVLAVGDGNVGALTATNVYSWTPHPYVTEPGQGNNGGQGGLGSDGPGSGGPGSGGNGNPPPPAGSDVARTLVG